MKKKEFKLPKIDIIHLKKLDIILASSPAAFTPDPIIIHRD